MPRARRHTLRFGSAAQIHYGFDAAPFGRCDLVWQRLGGSPHLSGHFVPVWENEPDDQVVKKEHLAVIEDWRNAPANR